MTHPFPHDPEELRRIAEGRLAPAPPRGIYAARAQPARGDHDLNPADPLLQGLDGPDNSPPRPAAVLVPIVGRRSGLTVLLTRRAAHLASHAGQISFPGGKLEPDDAGPGDAALREAEEEIGLARQHVDVMGYLDSYQTATGYRIVPAVALISPGFDITPDGNEVAEVFEVPLGFLMDAANHHRHSIEWRGRIRYYYAMPFEDRYIWGATAGILRNLQERLFG